MGSLRTTLVAAGSAAVLVAGSVLTTVGVQAAAGASVLPVAKTATYATVYACVRKSDGAMRQVKKSTTCAKGERRIAWPGKAGTGPAGPTGPTGPAGPTGPIGPSNAYQAVNGDAIEIVAGDGVPWTPLVSRRLPAGSYVVTASADVELPASASYNTAECTLTVDGTQVLTEGGPLWSTTWAPISVSVPSPPFTTTASVTYAVTVAENQSVALACRARIGFSGSSSWKVLTATKVGAVTAS